MLVTYALAIEKNNIHYGLLSKEEKINAKFALEYHIG